MFLQVMQGHIGASKGVHGDALALEVQSMFPDVKCTPRDVRHLVMELRTDGHHVCGKPGSGYFMAQNAEELNETLVFLHDRALSSLKQVAAMKRVSVPDLFGQHRIKET
jgi:hypothetical protein